MVEPAAIAAAVEAEAQAATRSDQVREALARDLEAARYTAERAFRQYDAADPTNRLVAAELETRWNRALTCVAAVEAKIAEHDVWAMDFLHDQLATGRKIRVLAVVDLSSRFSPVLDARFSYRAEDVVQTLDRVCTTIGYPKTIRVDQGTEFVSRDLDIWAYMKGVTLDFSRPGRPIDLRSPRHSTAASVPNA